MHNEHICEDEIKCPHCDYEYSDSWEYNHCEDDKLECLSCDKAFALTANNTVDYSTKVFDCKDDDHKWGCGSYNDIDQETLDRWKKDSVMAMCVKENTAPHWLWTRRCLDCTEEQYSEQEPNSKDPWEVEDV